METQAAPLRADNVAGPIMACKRTDFLEKRHSTKPRSLAESCADRLTTSSNEIDEIDDTNAVAEIFAVDESPAVDLSLTGTSEISPKCDIATRPIAACERAKFLEKRNSKRILAGAEKIRGRILSTWRGWLICDFTCRKDDNHLGRSETSITLGPVSTDDEYTIVSEAVGFGYLVNARKYCGMCDLSIVDISTPPLVVEATEKDKST